MNAAQVKADSHVLDVACGPGYAAGQAAARGASVVGVDFAPAMLDEARRRFPQAEFLPGEAEHLDFDDASFNAVICNFGLLHVAAPEKAVAEAHRVLKPSGRYAFTVWHGPDKGLSYFSCSLGPFKRTPIRASPCRQRRRCFASAITTPVTPPCAALGLSTRR